MPTSLCSDASTHNPTYRMLASGALSGASRWPTSRGFTLVEMLASFVIIGTMAAVAVPRLQQWYDGIEQRTHLSELLDGVKRLHSRAILLGQDVALNSKTASERLADGKVALTLPAQWTLAPDARLNVPSTGVCATGELQVKTAAKDTVRVSVQAPGCRITGGYVQGP